MAFRRLGSGLNHVITHNTLLTLCAMEQYLDFQSYLCIYEKTCILISYYNIRCKSGEIQIWEEEAGASVISRLILIYKKRWKGRGDSAKRLEVAWWLSSVDMKTVVADQLTTLIF